MYFFISVKKLGNENFKATVFTLCKFLRKFIQLKSPTARVHLLELNCTVYAYHSFSGGVSTADSSKSTVKIPRGKNSDVILHQSHR